MEERKKEGNVERFVGCWGVWSRLWCQLRVFGVCQVESKVFWLWRSFDGLVGSEIGWTSGFWIENRGCGWDFDGFFSKVVVMRSVLRNGWWQNLVDFKSDVLCPLVSCGPGNVSKRPLLLTTPALHIQSLGPWFHVDTDILTISSIFRYFPNSLTNPSQTRTQSI